MKQNPVDGGDWVFSPKIQRRIDNTKKETKRERKREGERKRGERKKRNSWKFIEAIKCPFRYR